MSLNSVTLTGKLPGAAGAVAWFTPSNWLADPTDQLLEPPIPVPAVLSGNGSFSVSLLATDNANLPAGWSWTVNIVGIEGVGTESFSFNLAFANGATQDISQLATISNPTPIAPYLPVPSGTPTAGNILEATGVGQGSQWSTPAAAKIFGLLGATPAGGFALQNATPTIFTWTSPNDGNSHRVMLLGCLDVATAETGGSTQVSYTDPGGRTASWTPWGSAFGAGVFQPNIFGAVMVAPNTTVTFKQNAALTAGAATVYAELWGC